MCALGSEGFREIAGYVFLGWYVLNLDRSSLDVVLFEVVFDVNEFSAFGWSPVLGDEYCGLFLRAVGSVGFRACERRRGGSEVSVLGVLPPWLPSIRLHTWSRRPRIALPSFSLWGRRLTCALLLSWSGVRGHWRNLSRFMCGSWDGRSVCLP